ncbi:MAG: hypothetical protein ACXW0P_03700 [Solirubrobacterales bacterium]
MIVDDCQRSPPDARSRGSGVGRRQAIRQLAMLVSPALSMLGRGLPRGLNHPDRMMLGHQICSYGRRANEPRRRLVMAVSDQFAALSDRLGELSARTKEAEGRAADAQRKARGDLEKDVATVRESAQAQSKKLGESVDTGKDKISASWSDVQRSWNEHVAKVREEIEAKKAEHDVHRAERRAERRVHDAEVAVEFAYSAIEEAEYDVLEAQLALDEAAELSAT